MYCAAVREGVTGAEDFLEDRLLATALPQERDAIEDALTSAACAPAGVTREAVSGRLQRALYSPRPLRRLERSASCSAEGLEATREWAQRNWEAVRRRGRKLVEQLAEVPVLF